MFSVDPETRQKRLDKCKACEHYVKTTQSCGTLLVGETVPHGKTTRKLCGCIMPLKTQLRHMSCPLGKWKSTLKAKDVKELRTLLRGINNKISKDENVRLTKMFNRMVGTNRQVSSCAPCVKEMITKLKQLIDE